MLFGFPWFKNAQLKPVSSGSLLFFFAQTSRGRHNNRWFPHKKEQNHPLGVPLVSGSPPSKEKHKNKCPFSPKNKHADQRQRPAAVDRWCCWVASSGWWTPWRASASPPLPRVDPRRRELPVQVGFTSFGFLRRRSL